MLTSTLHSLLHFHNTAGTLSLERACYVRVTWHNAHSNHAAFRALLEQALQMMREAHCGRLLVDHRQAVPYSEEDVGWLLSDWVPRAVHQAGYRYAAFLASYDVFVRVATSSLSQYIREQFGVRYHYFEGHQEEDALSWLLAQPAHRPLLAQEQAVIVTGLTQNQNPYVS